MAARLVSLRAAPSPGQPPTPTIHLPPRPLGTHWAVRSARTGLPETAAVASAKAATKAERRAKEETQAAQREAEDNNLQKYHLGYDRWRPLDARIKELEEELARQREGKPPADIPEILLSRWGKDECTAKKRQN